MPTAWRLLTKTASISAKNIPSLWPPSTSIPDKPDGRRQSLHLGMIDDIAAAAGSKSFARRRGGQCSPGHDSSTICVIGGEGNGGVLTPRRSHSGQSYRHGLGAPAHGRSSQTLSPLAGQIGGTRFINQNTPRTGSKPSASFIRPKLSFRRLPSTLVMAAGLICPNAGFTFAPATPSLSCASSWKQRTRRSPRRGKNNWNPWFGKKKAPYDYSPNSQ